MGDTGFCSFSTPSFDTFASARLGDGMNVLVGAKAIEIDRQSTATPKSEAALYAQHGNALQRPVSASSRH